VGPWCQPFWTTKTCAIYVDNVHGRYCRVGPWCQTLWTRNVCSVELFSLAWLWATWLLFSNPPMKFKFLKVEDVADRWVPDVRLSEQ
jgi:hypothetical protein